MNCLRIWNREISLSSPLVVIFLRDQDVGTVRYQHPHNEEGQTYSGKNELKCSSHVRLSRSLDDAEHVFIEVENSHSTSSATQFHQRSVRFRLFRYLVTYPLVYHNLVPNLHLELKISSKQGQCWNEDGHFIFINVHFL